MSRIPLAATIYAVVAVALLPVNTSCAQSQESAAKLSPSRDNTLVQDDSGLLSSGSGPSIFVGKTGRGSVRRGLIAFDLRSAVPAGSTIESVSLTLHISRANETAQAMELRRLEAGWGEGSSSSDGGGGAPAATGDATWLHRFFDTEMWAKPGGDFSDSVSASTSVGGQGPYTWSSAKMAADVQSWLDDPSTNFGWILLGNEAASQTTKRFESKETSEPASLPELLVSFTPAAD